MSVRSALLPLGLHVASIIGAGTLTDGRFQPFAFLPIPREIPGSFIGLTEPKFNGSLQDAVPGESNFFYGWEDTWQSGPSSQGAVMDHGMDGWGYWIDEELGPQIHAWPDITLGNVSTGIQVTQAHGGVPEKDSVADINSKIFLYNIGHSTIGRALQDNAHKPGHMSAESSFSVEGGEEVANYAVREWETNNDFGVVGYSGWYYAEPDSGVSDYHASWDFKHVYVMYQGRFARRIDPGGIDWFCQIFKRWPSCRDPDNPAGPPSHGPGSGLIGRILDKILNGLGRQSRSCASSVFDLIEQEDGSKFIPTEFGDFRKPKDGEWTWTWPDDLDICIEVGDNVWREKFAHMLYGVLSNMTQEFRYDDLFNELSRNKKLMFLDALMPLWGPTFEETIKSLLIGLSYVGAPATPKDGEVSAFDNGVHGSCAQEFRTSIYKPGAWRDKLSGPGVDAYNNTISSYDVAWADWKGFARHKQKYPAHHRNRAAGGGIARSACGSYPANFKGHPADERSGAPNGPRCMQFIEWFGQDIDSKAVKKLHDMFFPHHLNADGTTNKWCDCYEEGTPAWDSKTGIGKKAVNFLGTV